MNIKQLKLKIDEFQKQIDDLKAKVDVAQNSVWEPEGGQYLMILGSNKVAKNSLGENILHNTPVLTRKTKWHAERSLKELRQYARLLAWRDENCPDYTVPESGTAHYVFHDGNCWDFGYSDCYRTLGVVYLPSIQAKKLADDLNDGVVVL